MTSTPKKLLAALDIRDGHYCAWHYPGACDVETLVPQHRANRGMGGRPSGMVAANLIWLCSATNGNVESDPVWAETARGRGIKISSHADPEQVPVLFPDGWYRLVGNDRVLLGEPEANELRALAGLISGEGYAY